MKIKDILVREDDTMKIKSVSGNDVTIDQGGTEIKTTADTLVPDAAHPGQFQMKPPDPSKMTPGATITPTTTEDGVDQGNIDVMRSAITGALTNSELSPEEKQAAQTLIIKDADGDVDADKTLINCLKALPAAMEELITAFSKLAEMGDAYMSGSHPYEPKFATLPPEDQAKYKQDIADLKAGIAKASQQLQQQKPELDKSLDTLKNTLAQAKPQKPQQEGHKDTIAQGGGDVGGDATDRFINQIRDKGYERKNRGANGAGTRSTLSEKDELYKWLTIAGIK
jgi:hypothetical protein